MQTKKLPQMRIKFTLNKIVCNLLQDLINRVKMIQITN